MFLLGWTWARFGLSHSFQCFSSARLGLDQALFWAKPFYQRVRLLGLGLWRLLCCAHVSRMKLWADLRLPFELRLRRLGPLTTNVNVERLRLAHLPFKQLKEKAYDLQLLFW